MTNYISELQERATSFIARNDNKLDIDIEDIFVGIDWDQTAANDTYFRSLTTQKVVLTRDITRRRNAARKAARLFDQLGTNPDTPLSFVKAWAEKNDVRVDWKGSMWIKDEFTTLIDLKRVMRMQALELDLRYERAAIDDATEQMHAEKMAERPIAMHALLSERKTFDWDGLAAFFATNERMPRELVIAVLQKFVHSARRKLAGKKVTYHLMPVIHGKQGCGKTYLIEKMVAPIAEATAWSDFEQLTDNRNITLFGNLVIVLDEMAKAHKSDTETVKHVITSEMLDRRPMRSNSTVSVLNRSTMIGASNHRLDEIVKDETGNRRFCELIYQRPEDRELADKLDFGAMWASIQPDDADPLEAHRDALAALQRDSVVMGPVEDWLANASLASGEYDTGGLYSQFLDYRLAVTPTIDFQSKTQNTFASELRRITDQDDSYGVRKVHTRRGNRWLVERDRHLSIVGGK